MCGNPETPMFCAAWRASYKALVFISCSFTTSSTASSSSSTNAPTTTALPSNAWAAASSAGKERLHQGHQVPMKEISTGLPSCSEAFHISSLPATGSSISNLGAWGSSCRQAAANRRKTPANAIFPAAPPPRPAAEQKRCERTKKGHRPHGRHPSVPKVDPEPSGLRC